MARLQMVHSEPTTLLRTSFQVGKTSLLACCRRMVASLPKMYRNSRGCLTNKWPSTRGSCRCSLILAQLQGCLVLSLNASIHSSCGGSRSKVQTVGFLVHTTLQDTRKYVFRYKGKGSWPTKSFNKGRRGNDCRSGIVGILRETEFGKVSPSWRLNRRATFWKQRFRIGPLKCFLASVNKCSCSWRGVVQLMHELMSLIRRAIAALVRKGVVSFPWRSNFHFRSVG